MPIAAGDESACGSYADSWNSVAPRNSGRKQIARAAFASSRRQKQGGGRNDARIGMQNRAGDREFGRWNGRTVANQDGAFERVDAAGHGPANDDS